jgi:hypothetical protein
VRFYAEIYADTKVLEEFFTWVLPIKYLLSLKAILLLVIGPQEPFSIAAAEILLS